MSERVPPTAKMIRTYRQRRINAVLWILFIIAMGFWVGWAQFGAAIFIGLVVAAIIWGLSWAGARLWR
jgi:hypothetical protein